MKTIFIYFVSLFMIASIANAQTKDIAKTAPLVPTIAGKLGGKMTKDELLNGKGIIVTDTTFKVTEFKMSITGKNVKYKEFSATGNELNDDMRAAIKNAPAGTKIYFEFVKCAKEKCESRMSAPIQVILK
jgi:hypothetical protein